jgi:tetratricopeptide (TPR) repeat protein
MGYRAGRFWKRNRLRVIIAAAASLALTLAAGTAMYQARRANRRFQEVRSLANVFVFDVHDRIAKLPGSTEARQSIVTTALQYLERLRQDASNDSGLLLELAQTYRRIGDVQGHQGNSNVGDTKGALTSYERARDILTELNAGGDARAVEPLARTHILLAQTRFRLGDASAVAGDVDRATELISTAARRNPQDENVLTTAIEVHTSASRTYLEMNDVTRGVAYGEKAVEFAKKLENVNPSSPENREFIALGYRGLAMAQMAAGNLEGAAGSYHVKAFLRRLGASFQPIDQGRARPP